MNQLQIEVLFQQSWLQFQYGFFNNSITLLRTLLIYKPEHIRARRALILALIEHKQGQEALFQCALLHYAGYRDADLLLCETLAFQQEGLYEEALESYQCYLLNKASCG
ncbi:type III secretion protein [Morganella morganii]|nr:type III secretion protein [Morganella morganii]